MTRKRAIVSLDSSPCRRAGLTACFKLGNELGLSKSDVDSTLDE